MRRWEYLTVKVYDFGSEEAELKRHNDYWVSESGFLPLISRLGTEGWEAVCQSGRDLVMKRPADDSKEHAVVDMEAREKLRTGR
jgi:hypothetical protein